MNFAGWPAILIFLGFAIVLASLAKIQRGKFYEDTPWLSPLGVYVWGDGLVLGIFWTAVGVLSAFLPLLWLVRFLLIFYALRWFFEVIYWLNHQAHDKTFLPFFFQKRKLFSPSEAAIVYQLLHLCLTAGALFALLWSFAGV